MTVEEKGTQPTSATAKQWIAKRLRVEVNGPSTAEEDAAYTHLFHQAEASLGASVLANEIRTAKESADGRSVSRHDRMLELITALRRAGKLSREEFIFMAASQAIHLHEDRMMRGGYTEDVRAIEARIRAIEREEGLQDNEYWSVGNAPNEWEALQQQWNDIMDIHLNGVLRELGLQELAELRESDQLAFDAAFEQGRRALHHKDDHRNAVASLVGQYESEAKKAEAGHAPYAAIIMYGAACEARLLLRILDHPGETIAAVARLGSRRTPSDPMRWTLETLINVACEAGWLKGMQHPDANLPLLEWAHTLRSIRNLLHPGRHALNHPHVSIGDTQVHDARSIYIMISTALMDSSTGTDAKPYASGLKEIRPA